MNSKFIASLPAAALASAVFLAFPAPTFAQQNDQRDTAQAVSIIAGHNVVDALDDVRGSTDELVSALLDAGDRLGIDNWDQRRAELEQMQQRLDEMERELDEKAESTDSSWLSWLGDDDYDVTVTQQVQALGSTLQQISAMLGGSWDTRNMEIVVGQEILDQLDDLRETTGDLLDALSDASSERQWSLDPAQLEQHRAALSRLEQNLNRKREGGDAELRIFLREQQYHVLAHENVETIATILQSLLKSDNPGSNATE